MIHPASWTAKLYTRIPAPVQKLCTRLEKEAEKRAEARKKKKFAKEWRTLNEVLADPNSTEEEKRLARMELVAWEDPKIAERAMGDE